MRSRPAAESPATFTASSEGVRIGPFQAGEHSRATRLTRAKRPRAQAQEPGTVWTIAQLRAFLATARQHRLFVFFHVAAYTGARRGELLNLRWTDIDLDAKKITVTGSTAVIGGERVNGTTKSGRTRVVSIDDETVAVLRLRRADQAAEQLQAGDSWRGTKGGYVFTTGWGEPVYPDTVTSLMAKLIHAHNEPDQGPPPEDQLPHARLHDLRHLHATTLPVCSPASPCMSLRPASDTLTRLSPPARVRPRHPQRRGRCRRHLRPGRKDGIAPGLLADPLAKGRYRIECKNGNGL
jgi:Phage integrase family